MLIFHDEVRFLLFLLVIVDEIDGLFLNFESLQIYYPRLNAIDLLRESPDPLRIAFVDLEHLCPVSGSLREDYFLSSVVLFLRAQTLKAVGAVFLLGCDLT